LMTSLTRRSCWHVVGIRKEPMISLLMFRAIIAFTMRRKLRHSSLLGTSVINL
jgi:hypothetical protein